LLAIVLTLATLFLASWIFINAPTRRLLPLSVGAPEISAWLILGSLAAIGLSLPGVRRRVWDRWVLAAAVIAVALALTPLARFSATSRRAEVSMRAALGDNLRRNIPAGVRAEFRSRPLVLPELLGRIPIGAVVVTRDVHVGTPGGVSLSADVYRPPGHGLFPIVVQIYGGAWQRGAPGDNSEFARWLASRGYVVFGIDYRHAPAWHWPAQLDDVRLNLAWIRDHAAAYDADPSRVALLGRSAGAQLALIAAYTSGPLTVCAVVSYYGPVDLTDAYAHPPHPDPLRIRSVEEALVGGTPDEKPEAYRDASPITYATRRQPPTLLLNGDRDHIVEPRYGARLRDRLSATGTTVALIDIPWADHAFDEVFNGLSSQLSLYHMERFLAWAMAAPCP
jgi:acetyl esterase/lipase